MAFVLLRCTSLLVRWSSSSPSARRRETTTTKISLMNEVANLCEHFGANVKTVRQGVGSARRVGNTFIENARIGVPNSRFRGIRYPATRFDS